MELQWTERLQNLLCAGALFMLLASLPLAIMYHYEVELAKAKNCPNVPVISPSTTSNTPNKVR